MEVRTVPLVTGQEIVFELVTIDDEFIHVKSPMVFQTVRHPETGQPMSGFGEWPSLAACSDAVMKIPFTSVLCLPVKTHEEVERSYISNVTGMALPPATPQILLS